MNLYIITILLFSAILSSVDSKPVPGRCRKSMSKCARKRLRRPAFPETPERLRVTWSSDGLVGNRHFERDGKHFIEIQGRDDRMARYTLVKASDKGHVTSLNYWLKFMKVHVVTDMVEPFSIQELVPIGDGKYRIQSRIEETTPPRRHPLTQDQSLRESYSQQTPAENNNHRTPTWIEELASSQAGIWTNSRDHRRHHPGSNGNQQTEARAQQPARPRVEPHPMSQKSEHHHYGRNGNHRTEARAQQSERPGVESQPVPYRHEHHHSGRNGDYRTEARAQQSERPRVEPQPVSEKREEHIREGGEGHRTETRVDEPIPPRTAPVPVPKDHEKQAPTGAEDHEMDPRMEAGPTAAPVPAAKEHNRRVPPEAARHSQTDLRDKAASQAEAVPLQIPRASESTPRERFNYYDEIWYEPPDQGSYPRLLFSPRHGWREFTWEEARRVREIRPMQDNNHIRSSMVQSVPENEHPEPLGHKHQHQQQSSNVQNIPENGHREPVRPEHQQQSSSVQNIPENGQSDPVSHQHQQQYQYRNGQRGHPISHSSSVQQGSAHSHSGGPHQNNRSPHSHTAASNGGSQQNDHPSINRGALPRQGTVEISTEHKVEQDGGTWIFRRGEWQFEPRGAGGVAQAGPTTTAETFAPAYDSGMWVYHEGAWHYKSPSPQPAENPVGQRTSAPAAGVAVNRASGAKTVVKVRKFQKNNENQGNHHDLLAKAVLMDTETEKNRYNKDSDTDYNKWYASIRREQRDRQDRPSSPTSKGGYWYTYESVPAREATVVDDQINELSQMQSSLAQYVRKGNLGVMVMINDEEEQEEGDKKEEDGRKFRGASDIAEEGNVESSAYTEPVVKSENSVNDQKQQEGEDKNGEEAIKSQGVSYFVREGNIGAHVYSEPAREGENLSGGSVRIVQSSANGGDGSTHPQKNLSLDELKRLLQQKGYNLSEDELKSLQSQKGNITFRISSKNDPHKQEQEDKKKGEGSTSQGATYFIKEGNMGAHVYTEPAGEGGNSSGGRVRIAQVKANGGDGSIQKKINLSPDEIKRLLQQKGNVTIGGATYFVKEGNMGAYVRTEPMGGGENSSRGPVRIVQYSTTGGVGSKPGDGDENSSSTLVKILQGSGAKGPVQTNVNLPPDEIKRLVQQKGNVTIGGVTYFVKEGKPVGEDKNSSSGRTRIFQTSESGTGRSEPSKKNLSLEELKRLLQQKGYNLSQDELKRLQSQKGKITFRISSKNDQNKQEEEHKKEAEGGEPQGASYFVKKGNIGAYVYTEPVGEEGKSSGGRVRIAQSSTTGDDGSKTEDRGENSSPGRESIVIRGSATGGPAQPMKYLSVDEFKRLQPSSHKIPALKLKDASGIKPCDSEGATSGAGDFWLLRTRPCSKNSPEGRIILPNGDVLRFYGQPQLVNV